MEDASGEDLDWFWRGWFYGTDPVDISLDSVKYAKADLDAKMPASNRRSGGVAKVAPPAVNSFEDISKVRNRTDKRLSFQTDKDTATQDFYWKYDRGMVTVDTAKFSAIVKSQPAPQTFATESLTADEKTKYGNKYFYELNFSNKGGLVMPIIVEFTFKDGTKMVDHIPAQIWRLNEKTASKFYIQDKEVASIKLDPMRETADIDESNNYWGKLPEPSKFQLFKQRAGGPVRGQSTGVNPMQVSSK
jgi:hypothetical protein